MSKKHELKTWTPYFKAILSGKKRFEYRFNDREFEEGDTLLLKEYSEREGYTGREVEVKVDWILEGGYCNVPLHYCIMSISKVDSGSEKTPTNTQSDEISDIKSRLNKLEILVTNMLATVNMHKPIG